MKKDVFNCDIQFFLMADGYFAMLDKTIVGVKYDVFDQVFPSTPSELYS